MDLCIETYKTRPVRFREMFGLDESLLLYARTSGHGGSGRSKMVEDVRWRDGGMEMFIHVYAVTVPTLLLSPHTLQMWMSFMSLEIYSCSYHYVCMTVLAILIKMLSVHIGSRFPHLIGKELAVLVRERLRALQDRCQICFHQLRNHINVLPQTLNTTLL